MVHLGSHLQSELGFGDPEMSRSLHVQKLTNLFAHLQQGSPFWARTFGLSRSWHVQKLTRLFAHLQQGSQFWARSLGFGSWLPDSLYRFNWKLLSIALIFLKGYRERTFQKRYLEPLKRPREEVRDVFRFALWNVRDLLVIWICLLEAPSLTSSETKRGATCPAGVF